MFSLHDTTRTQTCRALFVALCLLPTTGVALWCWVVHWPSYARWHARAAGERLGWRVTLDRVTSPRPGTWTYEGVSISDPETGHLLVAAPFIEIDQQTDKVSIRLPYPATINGRRLETLLRAAQRQLRSPGDWQSLSLEAPNVTVRMQQGGDHTLADVSGQIEHAADASRLAVTFRLATADAGRPADLAPAELSCVCPHDAADKTLLQFKTGGPLPCRLVAACWPAATRLGAAATFTGRVSATEAEGRWRLELAGNLNTVDLERLMAPFPHRLTGTADVQIAQAVVQEGRVETVKGQLRAGPGVVSRSLIQSALAHLRLEAPKEALMGTENRLPYRQLGLAFEVDSAGLTLQGTAAQAPGVVLVGDTQVLVRQAATARLPVVNLVRTLVPQSTVQVPATRETHELARLLPIPPTTPPAGSEGPLPRARTINVPK